MLYTLDLHFADVDEAIAAFVIPSSEGLILIETGPHATFLHLTVALSKHGYKPSDVRHVLLTHIHLDHAGAAWAFAALGAQIHVHPFGMRHLTAPEKLMASARRIYKDDMDRLWGNMNPISAAAMRGPSHGEVLDFGDVQVRAWHTPGHAVHHIAWEWNGNLFTGDVAGVRIQGMAVCPPCPPPDIQIEDWKKSLACIREVAPHTMHLTHFGAVTDIEAHLNELERKLDAWAGWIKPYWEQQADPASITPQFQAYVQQQLLDEGVPEKLLAVYEAANPSWMSVAGLMRYWQKYHGA